MPNTVQYASIFQTTLDELAVQDALTNWTEANAGTVRYNGGKEIKIPKRTLEGLSDYDRETGYPLGAVSVSWETTSLTQDRGKKFRLDAQDVDETNFVLEASAVLGQFQREYVVPEIDAYRIAKMYEAAAAAGQVTTSASLTAEDILAGIKQDIAKVQNNGADDCVIHISYAAKAMLETSTSKVALSNITWAPNGIDTQIPAIDNHPLIATPDKRMYTNVTINENSGYTGTGHINWLVVGRKAPIGISKTDVPRIFSPDVNQQADAWDVTYRKYHDIIIPDNKKILIAANIQGE